MALLQQRVGTGLTWLPDDSSRWSRIEVRSRRAAGSDRYDGARMRVLLHAAAGRLELPALHFLTLVSGVVIDPAWPDGVIADIARLAVACIDTDLALALGGDLECTTSPEGTREESCAATDRVELVLTLVSGGHEERHAFTVRTTVEAALWWLAHERWRKLDLPRSPSLFERVTCTGDLLLGRSRLGVAEVSGLRVGDAIVLEECFSPDPETCVGQFGNLHVKIRASSPTRILCDSLEREDLVIQPAVLEGGATSPIDEIPVTMCFAAGQITMTLAQMRTLGAGGIVELDREASAEVAITVNGVLIGVGELIDINGRLAVEIVTLSGT
jgi:type III secretion protein Q